MTSASGTTPLTIVAAITSKLSRVPYPIEVTVPPTKANGLSLSSAVNLGEIRSVGRARLLKRLGTLNAGAMRRVDEALKISLGLASL